MYNSNKSFSTLSLVLVFVLIAFNSAKGIDLPFNPSNYHFLVYDPGAGSNIKEAMNILGISYDLRDKDHPVDANDLQTYAILIVGWNEGASSMGGLDPTTLLNGINGRVVLTGHDLDFHTVQRNFYAQTMLINAINYVLQGGEPGLVCLADPETGTNAFSYLPKTQWAITAESAGALELINTFTPAGLATGIFDSLSVADMSNWAESYHAKFTINPGSSFVPFELGSSNGADTVTIARTDAPPLPSGCTVNLTIDDVPGCKNFSTQQNPVSIMYNIRCSSSCQLNDVNIIDTLPPEADYNSCSDGGTYDPNSHSVKWILPNPITAGYSHTFTLTVKVPQLDVPCSILTNKAVMYPGQYVPIAAIEQTNICGSIRNVTKKPPVEYDTISNAFFYADYNDVIELGMAIYNESVEIPSNKKVNIQSTYPENKAVVANTIIDVDQGYTIYTTSLTSHDFSIYGLTLNNNGSAYSCIYGRLADVNIVNCVISANGTAIDLWPAALGAPSNANIAASKISAGGSCISASNSNITVDNCLLSGTYGIKSSAIYSPRNTTVRNCRIENCYEYGISANGISLNAYNNKIHGSIPSTFTSSGSGIYLNAPRAACQIYNNLIYQNVYGIKITSNTQNAQITMRNNTVVDNGTNLTGTRGIVRSVVNLEPVINSIIWGNGSGTSGSNIASTSNISYSFIQGIASGSPGFVDDINHDYHLLPNSTCKDPVGTVDPLLDETDIDGQPRKLGSSVDMGADEYAFDFTALRDFLSAWLSNPQSANWISAYDRNSDNIINFRDLASLASYWSPPAYMGDGLDMGMSQESSEIVLLEDSSFNEQLESVTEEEQSEYDYIPDYNFPAIYLTCDNNSPDPNTEVTVYVHSDTPLLDLFYWSEVLGDAELTAAMSTADCNQYGWDPGWQMDSYFDMEGLVGIGGVKFESDASGTVGYFKFIYHGGLVTVSTLNDWSGAYSWDEQGIHTIPFAQQPLLIGRDPNE